MNYHIVNIMDSDWNLFGLKYRVVVRDPSVPEPKEIPQSASESPHILEKKVFEAKYDAGWMHKATIAECIGWIIEDAVKRGSLNDAKIEFSVRDSVKL